MKTDIWMPLYVSDYISDTQGLDAEEHGIYFCLMMNYWKRGPLKDSDRLSKIANTNNTEKLDYILSNFFRKEGDIWRHKRLDKEILKAKEKREKAMESGLKGGRPKTLKKPNGYSEETERLSENNQTVSERFPEKKRIESSSQSQSQSHTESESKEEGGNAQKRFTPPTIQEARDYGREYTGKRFNDAERFIDFYASKGWKVGSSKMKDWKASLRNWTRKDSTGPTSKEIDDKGRRREKERKELEASRDGRYDPKVMEAVFATTKASQEFKEGEKCKS